MGLLMLLLGSSTGFIVINSLSQDVQPKASPTSQQKLVGTVQAIDGRTVTLTVPDSNVRVTIPDGVHIVRIQPGQKDLESASAIDIHDVQPGDRMLVRVEPGSRPDSVVASAVMVMTRTDLQTKHQHDREDWQKRGVGGLVSAVDPAAGTVSIVAGSLANKQTTIIRISKDTVVRRYAPDSVKFDEARPSTLAEIHSGDQLRARGTRTPAGNEFMADEVISGSFRNIAGVITSVDATGGTIGVLDSMTRNPVVVKVTGDSELRKLPPEMAQRIGARLSGTPTAASGYPARGTQEPGARPAASPPFEVRRNGGRDLQQMLQRLPAVNLHGLQKGDSVMLVSTQGTNSGQVTAITLLAGVEPILAAVSKGGEPMTLSPWSLGQGGGDEGSQ